MEHIPLSIQRLFWDMDARRLDVHAHAKTIIERVLNTGTLEDWRWLTFSYGNAKISDVLSKKGFLGRENIRPRARRLASLILK